MFISNRIFAVQRWQCSFKDLGVLVQTNREILYSRSGLQKVGVHSLHCMLVKAIVTTSKWVLYIDFEDEDFTAAFFVLWFLKLRNYWRWASWDLAKTAEKELNYRAVFPCVDPGWYCSEDATKLLLVQALYTIYRPKFILVSILHWVQNSNWKCVLWWRSQGIYASHIRWSTLFTYPHLCIPSQPLAPVEFMHIWCASAVSHNSRSCLTGMQSGAFCSSKLVLWFPMLSQQTNDDRYA